MNPILISRDMYICIHIIIIAFIRSSFLKPCMKENVPSLAWLFKSAWYPRRELILGLVSMCMRGQSLSHVRLIGTPWTVAHQAPLLMGLSRQEYWSGLPRILKWVTEVGGGLSSPPRDWTRISCTACIGRWILYHWVTWEAQICLDLDSNSSSATF